jgi:hypothetical protein
MTKEHNKVWVNYPCGKKVKVNYKGKVDNFIRQLDEYNKYGISIFIEGCEDELDNIPQNTTDVFCLLTTPSYLKEGESILCGGYYNNYNIHYHHIIKKITSINQDKDKILMVEDRYRQTDDSKYWVYESSDHHTIIVNKTHTKIITDVDFVPSDFKVGRHIPRLIRSRYYVVY